MITPSAVRIGETDSDTSTMFRLFFRRLVS